MGFSKDKWQRLNLRLVEAEDYAYFLDWLPSETISKACGIFSNYSPFTVSQDDGWVGVANFVTKTFLKFYFLELMLEKYPALERKLKQFIASPEHADFLKNCCDKRLNAIDELLLYLQLKTDDNNAAILSDQQIVFFSKSEALTLVSGVHSEPLSAMPVQTKKKLSLDEKIDLVQEAILHYDTIVNLQNNLAEKNFRMKAADVIHVFRITQKLYDITSKLDINSPEYKLIFRSTLLNAAPKKFFSEIKDDRLVTMHRQLKAGVGRFMVFVETMRQFYQQETFTKSYDPFGDMQKRLKKFKNMFSDATKISELNEEFPSLFEQFIEDFEMFLRGCSSVQLYLDIIFNPEFNGTFKKDLFLMLEISGSQTKSQDKNENNNSSISNLFSTVFDFDSSKLPENEQVIAAIQPWIEKLHSTYLEVLQKALQWWDQDELLIALRKTWIWKTIDPNASNCEKTILNQLKEEEKSSSSHYPMHHAITDFFDSLFKLNFTEQQFNCPFGPSKNKGFTDTISFKLMFDNDWIFTFKSLKQLHQAFLLLPMTLNLNVEDLLHNHPKRRLQDSDQIVKDELVQRSNQIVAALRFFRFTEAELAGLNQAGIKQRFQMMALKMHADKNNNVGSYFDASLSVKLRGCLLEWDAEGKFAFTEIKQSLSSGKPIVQLNKTASNQNDQLKTVSLAIEYNPGMPKVEDPASRLATQMNDWQAELDLGKLTKDEKGHIQTKIEVYRKIFDKYAQTKDINAAVREVYDENPSSAESYTNVLFRHRTKFFNAFKPQGEKSR